MSKKIIDLTMPIEEGMQTFPVYWHPFVEITQLGRHGIENRETRKLVLGTHTGTHVDAPKHFIPNGLSIDEISLDLLIGTARAIDLSSFGPEQEVSKKGLMNCVDEKLPKRILLRFDWDKFLGKSEYYSRCPFLSKQAAEWLVDMGCTLVGMDTPMPDNPKNSKGTSNDSPIHKILLGNNIVLAEYLVNIKLLGDQEFNLIVAPLKIKSADGSPARIFGVINN